LSLRQIIEFKTQALLPEKKGPTKGRPFTFGKGNFTEVIFFLAYVVLLWGVFENVDVQMVYKFSKQMMVLNGILHSVQSRA